MTLYGYYYFHLLCSHSSLLPFQNGLPCHVSDENIKASLLMYASYFVLFCKFFYDTYMSKMKSAKSASALGKMTWKITSCKFFAREVTFASMC